MNSIENTMAMPSVLIDCGHTHNTYSGLGQVTCQYASALTELATSKGQEFSPYFITHPRFKEFHHLAHSNGWHSGKTSFSLWGALRRLSNKEWTRYAWHGQGHAVRHALHRNCCHIPLSETAPFILTIHDMHLLQQQSTRRHQSLARLQWFVRRASALGFISQYAQKIAAEYVDFGNATQHIIYNGVNKPQNPRRPSWFRDDMHPFLFSVAQITPSKNYHILPPVLTQLPGMKLIIAGRRKKYYAPQVEEAAWRAGISERMWLPGVVSEEEKAFLFQHCTGFVFPSLREGFGIPVVEALHFGKPVFCFSNTALPEVGGKHVFYWQDDSPTAMAEVVSCGLEENSEAPQAARKAWAARFSWQRAAEQYAALYQRMME